MKQKREIDGYFDTHAVIVWTMIIIAVIYGYSKWGLCL